MTTEAFERCNQILQHIMEDTSVPRNIRRAAEESRDLLAANDDEPSIRASTVISILDEISKCILLCANCHAEIHAGLHRKI